MSQSLSIPPAQFLIYNAMAAKNLVVIVDIEGLDLFTSQTVKRYLEYGDPYVYGGPITYGQVLVNVGIRGGERQQRNLLSLEGGSLTISQRLEPEQGRGSISTISMSFIDKDGYMTRACASGPIVDEILGKQVRVWIGYKETAFPEDYFVVWRGRVGQVNFDPAKCTIQFVDPNVVRRQQIFFTSQTTLASDIDNSTTTIPVVDNSAFYSKILGPDGVSYDQDVKLFIKIDDEYMQYQQTGHESDGSITNQFQHVLRGNTADAHPDVPLVTPQAPAAHTAGTTVDSFLQISGNCMEMALKIMMSGWGGPFLSDQAIVSLDSNKITVPAGIDAVRDLGITMDDWFTISGDAVSGNNQSGQVTGFEDLAGQTNRVILTNKTFAFSNPSPAMLAVRSQYDVWPLACGSRLPGWEVDVAQFQYYANTYLIGSINSYRFLISASDAGKTFIENQILLPVGAYSLTRQGKISVGLTKPPIADQRTQTLDISNVVNPQSIQVQRGVNNRKFFNEIDWTYDYDDGGSQNSTSSSIDSDSLNIIGISSVLPITANGGRTDLGFADLIADRDTLLLNRYKRGSVLINIQTTIGVGNQIEVGDVIVINDSGELKIPNFSNGERNIGIQLYEVINRTLDFASATTSLQVEGGTGAEVTDRYATISPSSQVTGDSTSSQLIIEDSYGALFPGQEYLKWQAYVGLDVRVHDANYTNVGTTTFTGFDPSNSFAMNLSPALGFTPSSGYIVDICQYPTSSDPTDQLMYKVIHAFLDPTTAVTSGVDHFSFNVGVGDESRFVAGFPVLVHNTNYSTVSPETTIVSIVGTLVTVADDLGFTPDNTMQAELTSFPDAGTGPSGQTGQPYRLI